MSASHLYDPLQCLHVLAYLISKPGHPSLVGDHRPTRIIWGGLFTEDLENEETLTRFSKVFSSIREEECAFDALYERLPFKWDDTGKDDAVNPFGDSPRQIQYHALWTFDTDQEVLRFADATCRREIPFATLRSRPIHLNDMELLGGPFLLPSEPSIEPDVPVWSPNIAVENRMRAFVHPLLRDFHHQWRHVLRNEYNPATRRRLSRAIIRLVTLDFEVREDTGGHGRQGVHVWILQSPFWEPFNANIVRVGTLWVVLCQDVTEGLSIVRKHSTSSEFTATQKRTTPGSDEAQAHYMILSVRHVVLCHVAGPESIRCTTPERLFDGDSSTSPPSELAMDCLIWATASARPIIPALSHTLPIEIQDMVLQHVSLGTVEAARIGCLLAMGSVFLWMDGPLKVKLEERHKTRPRGMPVESEIWFDEHKSGVVYKAKSPLGHGLWTSSRALSMSQLPDFLRAWTDHRARTLQLP